MDGDKAARQPPRKNVANHCIWRRLERNATAFRLFDCPVDVLWFEAPCAPSRALEKARMLKKSPALPE